MPQNVLRLAGSFHDEGNHPHRRQPSSTCTWLSVTGWGGRGNAEAGLSLGWLLLLPIPSLLGFFYFSHVSVQPGAEEALERESLLITVLLPLNILCSWEYTKAFAFKRNGQDEKNCLVLWQARTRFQGITIQ